MERLICPDCNSLIEESDSEGKPMPCPICGRLIGPEQARKEEPLPGEGASSTEEPSTVLVPEQHKPEFTGSAGEYFRIWIVNMFLTIFTLGIYAAWAKVRTRQYFHAHTVLAGHPFEYRAKPTAILRGNVIIGGGILIYAVVNFLGPSYISLVVAAFYLVIPLLICLSLRFYAHNSAYRNMRFRFLGTLGQSYKTYLLIPLLIPLTLGIIAPYWAFRRKKYFFDNFAFGTTTNTFTGLPGPFYKFYILAALMLIGLMFAAGLIFAATTVPLIKGRSVVIIPFLMYILFLAIFTLIQEYVRARVTNYCWGKNLLGGVRFQSTLRARRLCWIRLTNICAILFSFGFLIPWAKVRRTRYILDNLTVIAHRSLDDFKSATEEDISAVGDTATDFFGIEIGL